MPLSRYLECFVAALLWVVALASPAFAGAGGADVYLASLMPLHLLQLLLLVVLLLLVIWVIVLLRRAARERRLDR